MPVMTRAFSAAALAPDLYHAFIEDGRERPMEFATWINVDTMPWNPVKDRQYAGMGAAPKKLEGQSFTFDQGYEGGEKVYTASADGLAFEVTFEFWDDELYGLAPEFAAGLARSLRYAVEVAAASILNNAFSTSSPGFASGESLCSTSHAAIAPGGAAQANRPSPDIGFSTTYIQNAILRFEGMANERGLPEVRTPVMHIIHQANKFAAREILGSLGRPYSADNERNALIEEDLSWMVYHYLSSSTAHFQVAAKENHDAHLLWKNQPMFDSWDDPQSKNAMFSGYQRYAVGFGSWRGIDGSTG
jgi:hypothetical protein